MWQWVMKRRFERPERRRVQKVLAYWRKLLGWSTLEVGQKSGQKGGRVRRIVESYSSRNLARGTDER
jgi:hypothetical protein